MADPIAELEIATRLNGVDWRGVIPVDESLLDFVRERAGLLGAKRSCELQVCGACTVLVDGEPVSACSTFAMEVDGCDVRTVEGLQHGDELAPLQQAFVEEAGVQCGYCTSGQLLTATALLERHPHPSHEEIADWMSGNVCRCGCYPAIARAILKVSHDEAVRSGGT